MDQVFQQISDNVALSQKIVSQITDAIIHGELKTGDRIPPERDLATQFGVSRTAIRDAIKILSGRGVLDVRHGTGIFVASADKDFVLGFSGADIQELFEIRHTLETQAASWAAQRGTPEHLKRLRKIVAEARSNADALTVLSEKDAQFHVAIAEASENMLLVKIMWMLLDALGESRKKSLDIPNRALESLREHEQILDAIAAGHAEEARMLMEFHLRSVRKAILGK